MYKLVIADDERLLRKSLIASIDWDAMGIEVVEAENGRQALDLIRAEVPHILLTDVRMPAMTGLELIQALRREQLDLKTIIISGYDEFAYAQQAIRLGAIGYILKPIDNQDIVNMVNKSVEMIEEERERVGRVEALERKLKDSLPSLREKFLGDLARGDLHPLENLAEKLRMFGLESYENSALEVFVVEIDQYRELRQSHTPRSLLSKKLTLKQALERETAGVAFEHQDNQIVLVCPMAEVEAEAQAMRVAQQIQAEAERATPGIAVSIGVSLPIRSPLELAGAFEQAQTAVRNKLFAGYRSIIPASELAPRKRINYSALVKHKMELLRLIEACDQAGVDETIAGIGSLLQGGEMEDTEAVKAFLLEMIVSAKQIAPEGPDSSDVIGTMDSLSR
jgi:two-component system response regulator YesN